VEKKKGRKGQGVVEELLLPRLSASLKHGSPRGYDNAPLHARLMARAIATVWMTYYLEGL
jgi:hypothetical protein